MERPIEKERKRPFSIRHLSLPSFTHERHAVTHIHGVAHASHVHAGIFIQALKLFHHFHFTRGWEIYPHVRSLVPFGGNFTNKEQASSNDETSTNGQRRDRKRR